MKQSAWLASAAVAGLLFCIRPGVAFAAPQADLASPRYGPWGFDLQGIDNTVKPGDDFYKYVNGNGLKTLQISPDRTRNGSFDRLIELSEKQVRAILEDDMALPPGDGAVPAKIGAFYRSYMDEARIEALGDTPLQADLAHVRAATSREDIASLMGEAHDGVYATIFEGAITNDFKTPGKYMYLMFSEGLGLPDRDNYLSDSEHFQDIRTKYIGYIAHMLSLAKWPDAEANARSIMALETKLAKASWTRIQERDRDKTYNPLSPTELASYAPGFDWGRYFTALGIPHLDRVVVLDNTALAQKAKIVGETSLETLKAWEAFHTIDGTAALLNKAYVDAEFDFRSKTLNGQPEQRARWKRAVATIDDLAGEAVGQEYVKRYFPASSKAQVLELANNLKLALRHRIENLDWMGPQTKQEALRKLDSFNIKIGYPATWRSFSLWKVSNDDLYENIRSAHQFEWNREVARFYQPVDRAEWDISPQDVNAYYSLTLNEVVFPAAILQPPFFDPNADPAINYGGIGGVIGHEMSHGFDDQGRKSNAEGRLTDWWTTEDTVNFKQRADRLVGQYDANFLVPGEHIQGQLTLGENIGDLGGLNIALDAYRVSLHGHVAPTLDGFTGDQRVFLGWAQAWKTKIRDQALIQRLHTDAHSPAEARVNEVVRDVDAWYKAFNVTPGEKLYLSPVDRVHIW